MKARWRASLSHKENPRGGLDFYRDQFDQQKDEQVKNNGLDDRDLIVEFRKPEEKLTPNLDELSIC